MEKKEKKVIIGLWGAKNTGKTTTLRKLALQFLELPEVKEDIQIGFLVGENKIVVSTAKDDQVNTSFCEALNAHVLLTATRTKEPGEECAQRIIVDPKSIKEDNTGSKQEQVTMQKEKLIEPIAMQNEITTLRQFSLELLKSEVVKGDIQIAFHYKGKRILISTAGDDEGTVDEGKNLFKALKADILVTATRSRGYSREALKALEKDGEIKTKAIRIYKSDLTHGEPNDEIHNESLKESITKEQIETLKELIDEGLAKTIQSVIDQIITDWEK
ncbi:MAG: hypothetical protein HXN11_02905 [Porphyromonadaceae bacterium]|nr:hypothetical protein [Porphyromonadaceae bacterium]